MAKAVLRRDLAVCQADREKREQADAAERKRAVTEPSTAKTESPQQVPAAQPAESDAVPAVAEDVVMTDEPQRNGDYKSTDTVEQGGVDSALEQSATINGLEMNIQNSTLDHGAANDNASALSAMQLNGEASDATGQIQQHETDAKLDTEPENPSTTYDDLFESKSPTTAGVQDIDFDSMFNDLPSGGADGNNLSQDAGDFDFSFSGSAANDASTAFPSNNDAVSSLLPGLESYANIGGDESTSNQVDVTDFGMLDLPNQDGQNNTSSNDSSNDQQANNGAADDSTQPQGQFTGGSTYDDLFDFDLEMGDGATVGEGTEFEDALFGLGED